MKRHSLLFVVCVFVAIASPAVLACEQCFNKGSFDPVGNYLEESKCWSGFSTGYATCIPNGESCNTTTDSVCTAGGSGSVENPVPLTDVPPAPRAADCGTDLSGRCSRQAISVDSFLD